MKPLGETGCRRQAASWRRERAALPVALIWIHSSAMPRCLPSLGCRYGCPQARRPAHLSPVPPPTRRRAAGFRRPLHRRIHGSREAKRTLEPIVTANGRHDHEVPRASLVSRPAEPECSRQRHRRTWPPGRRATPQTTSPRSGIEASWAPDPAHRPSGRTERAGLQPRVDELLDPRAHLVRGVVQDRPNLELQPVAGARLQ